MKRGTLLLLVLLILMMSVFTACGNNDTPGDVGETTPEPTTEMETESESYDFGGRIIRMSGWWDLEPKAGRSDDDDLLLARIAEVEKEYNVKFNYFSMPSNYYENLITSILAGEPNTEIARITAHKVIDFSKQGLLTPVDEIKSVDLTSEKWNSLIKELATFDGKVYGFFNERYTQSNVVYFNKTMFEREGLENPYELQAKNEWTWDKMLEFAQKTTKDLDNDGVIDQWGMTTRDYQLFWMMIYANGGAAAEIKGSKYELALNEDSAIEAMNVFQKWCTVDKVVHLPPQGAAWDYAVQLFQDGKVAMLPYRFWAFWRFGRPDPGMNDDFGVVLMPKGPKGDGYTSVASGLSFNSIPAGVQNPDEVAIVWNAITEPLFEGEDPLDMYIESLTQYARDNESLETIRMIYENKEILVNHPAELFPGFLPTANPIIQQIADGVKTPAAAMEEVTPKLVEYINKAYAE